MGFILSQPVVVPETLPSSAEVGVISAAAASGPRIFVDVCCGGTRPLCVAFEALHLPVLPVDLLQDSPLDILSDDVFDCLLRLCFSGQVGLMHASPPCKEYSRLKLRPGIPKAIRSPEFLGGLPSNTPEMQSRVLSSRALLHRCVQLLECAFEGGGHCDLEQPTNAMSWLEDFVQAFLLRVHAHCISTPACRWGLDVAKSWMFASSCSLLHTLAGKCTHPANSHSSIAGVLDSFGGFASQQTAIYPGALCQAYASACSSLLAFVRPCTAPLSLAEAQRGICPKPQHGAPTATQDGGGISSVPDWSFPPLGVQDRMKALRAKLHSWLLEARVPCRLHALLHGQELSELFFSEEVSHARSLFSAWLQENGHTGHVCWDISVGQPYALHALHALSACLQDKDSALFPALLAGVPTGFDSDIPPSGCLLPAPPNENAFSLDLAICQGNWQGAEAEEDAGFVREFPSLEAAQSYFGADRVAVGRVNIVHSHGKNLGW